MSTNVSALGEAQAVAPVPVSTAGSPNGADDLSVMPPNNDGLQDVVQHGPPAITTAVSAQPRANAKLPPTKIRKFFTALTAAKGHAVGAHYAAGYHRSTKKPNPPTETELLLRVLDARTYIGEEKYQKHLQGSPNSVALRLLLEPAGQHYEFDEDITTFTYANGKQVTGRKCGDPDCEYRCVDQKRHMTEQHVHNPVLAFCCPYENCRVFHYYGAGRDSEIEHHLKNHKDSIKNAQQKGRRRIKRLSVYRLYHTPGAEENSGSG